jgi:hypothetical protein
MMANTDLSAVQDGAQNIEIDMISDMDVVAVDTVEGRLDY